MSANNVGFLSWLVAEKPLQRFVLSSAAVALPTCVSVASAASSIEANGFTAKYLDYQDLGIARILDPLVSRACRATAMED